MEMCRTFRKSMTEIGKNGNGLMKQKMSENKRDTLRHKQICDYNNVLNVTYKFLRYLIISWTQITIVPTEICYEIQFAITCLKTFSNDFIPAKVVKETRYSLPYPDQNLAPVELRIADSPFSVVIQDQEGKITRMIILLRIAKTQLWKWNSK